MRVNFSKQRIERQFTKFTGFFGQGRLRLSVASTAFSQIIKIDLNVLHRSTFNEHCWEFCLKVIRPALQLQHALTHMQKSYSQTLYSRQEGNVNDSVRPFVHLSMNRITRKVLNDFRKTLQNYGVE